MLLSAACSSDPAVEPAEPSRPTTTAAPAVSETPAPADPPNNITVSDAVPTLEELRNMGIADQAAECFINTIDPDGTGTVQSADLFIEAFGACL